MSVNARPVSRFLFDSYSKESEQSAVGVVASTGAHDAFWYAAAPVEEIDQWRDRARVRHLHRTRRAAPSEGAGARGAVVVRPARPC